jgi:nitroreductase
MNDALKAIFERRSIRAFRPDPLAAEQVDLLTRVALASPSANNRQPWHFHFLADPDLVGAVSDAALATFRRKGETGVLDWLASLGGGLFFGAPLVVLVTCPRERPSEIDAGIAVENLAIAAQSMGLGSCIIGLARAAFDGEPGEALSRRLGIGEDQAFVISIALGVAATTKEPHDMHPEKVTVLQREDAPERGRP